jgi:hypothetical protein
MPVNILAPYLLTALFEGPRRHMYISSGMGKHAGVPAGDESRVPVEQ